MFSLYGIRYTRQSAVTFYTRHLLRLSFLRIRVPLTSNVLLKLFCYFDTWNKEYKLSMKKVEVVKSTYTVIIASNFSIGK